MGDKILNIELYDNDSLTQSIKMSTKYIDAFVLHYVSISRYLIPDQPYHNPRLACVQGYYHVSSATFQFIEAVKPWRLVASQCRKGNIALRVTGWLYQTNTPAKQTKHKSVGLQALTNYAELAESVRSLVIESDEMKFVELDEILRKLHNIRQLRVVLSKSDLQLTACHALNQIRHLRSLHLNTVRVDKYVNPSAFMLFNRLTHGNIHTTIIGTKNATATVFAYKRLEIWQPTTEFHKKWNEFLPLCSDLAHVIIWDTQHQTRSNIIVPSNLVSLEIYNYSMTHVALVQVYQPLLIRLVLQRVNHLKWTEFVTLCPYIRDLILRIVEIRGRIIGFPLRRLRELDLAHVRMEHKEAFVRLMCAEKLSRLRIDSSRAWFQQNGVLRDWISNPQFLVGSYIYLRSQRPQHQQSRLKRGGNTQRIKLFCRHFQYLLNKADT